jgi:flagellar biosynthesis protein FlhB
MSSSGERTEKATPRRLLKARREGQVASSRDFVSGLQFAVFTLLLVETGPRLFGGLKEAARLLITQAFRSDLGPAALLDLVHQAFASTLIPLLTASAVLVATGLLFQLGSTGFGVSLSRLAPKGANFNPISKLKSAGQRGVTSAVQGALLLGVFALTIYSVIRENAARLYELPLMSLANGLTIVRSLCQDVLWKAAAFFLLMGAIDLFRERRRFANRMKMSKQDLREESKESDGNPLIKVRIRRLQRDVRRRRMMDEVKTATAVIVNPTHYAVAIRYEHDSMPAPVVVAKGKNFLAQRIRARAIEHQIPLIENRPLAQALYKSVDVGQQIPAHLYRAVAEILAYIYKLMGSKSV